MAKTVLITGSSSGFGKATAMLFKDKGWNVAATMRSPEKAGGWPTPLNIFTPQLDVTDLSSVSSAIGDTIAKFGKIDVLVNNAGFGLMGPLEGVAFEDLRREVDTNLLGAIAMIQGVLPHMRKAGGGVIINVSSVGGRVTFPLYSTYHATKFALEGLSEALQYELQQHHIRVKLIEPGASKTNFGGTRSVITPHPAYGDLMDGISVMLKKVQENAPGPEKVARMIFKASIDGSARLRYPVLSFPYLNLRGVVGARGWAAMMKGMARRAVRQTRRRDEAVP